MPIPELLLRAGCALILILGTLVSARVIVWRLLPGAGIWLGLAAMVVVGMWLSAAGFHLLARLSLFTLPAALASIAALVGGIVVWTGPRRVRELLRRDRRALGKVAETLRRGRWRVWTVAFTVLAGSALVRAAILPPLGWDTTTYHAVKAASWAQQGSLVYLDGPGSWALYKYLLGGGEIFTAWTLLPFSGDDFASLGDAAMWLSIGVGAFALARELGIREPFGTLSAGFLMAVPTVRLEIASGYVELAQLAALTPAMALAVRFLRRREPGALLLAAAGLGVACSIKATLLLAGGVALAGLAIAAMTRPLRPAALLGGMLAFSAVVAPWLVDSARLTGYPLSPYPLKVAGITLGEMNPTMKWTFDRPEVRPLQLEVERAALAKLFRAGVTNSLEGLGLPTAGPLLVFVATALWAIVSGPGRRRVVWAFLLGFFATVVYSVFRKDFGLVRLGWPHATARFWLPAVAVAIPASVAWCARWPGAARVYRAYLLIWAGFSLARLLAWGYSDFELDGAFGLCVCALIFVVVVVALARAPVVLRRATLVVVAVGSLVWLDQFKSYRRWDLVSNSTALHGMPKEWVPGARLLDEPEHPHRIAVTAGPKQGADTWWCYYFFGRRLQNRLFYVPVSADGAIVEYTAVDTLRPRADPAAWLARLDAREADFVVALPPRYIEVEWMEALPARFVRVAGAKRDWGVFRVIR